uniref:Uncharacterized protein n=1 Tax=Mycena chlorophos TaxID=658473 RepID=A0ABQ0L112_MYCCL|nr:predicted protein [Mycena chlorophos]
MTEISDPALYVWVVMGAELRRRSEVNAEVLTPDCAITPTHFLHALKRHDKRFLGRARFNVDFFAPSQHGLEDGLFTVTQDRSAALKEVFTCVFAGEIARIQQDNAGSSFSEILLSCPNWIRSGWPTNAFADMWEAQRLTLREVLRFDFYGQVRREYSGIRSWFEDQQLLVNFGNGLPHPVCLVPLDDGSYEATEPITTMAEFPFKVGDTVVIEDQLHRRSTQCNLDSGGVQSIQASD